MADVATLILAAVTAELAPLVRRLSLQRDPGGGPVAWRGVFLDRRVAAAAMGIGPLHAAASTRAAIQSYHPSRVLITGTAGGCAPGLKTGDIITPELVVDAATDERLTPTISAETAGALWSFDRVIASPTEKAKLYFDARASAVDMETAAAARVCADRGVPWLCVRAILDTADETLPAVLMRLTRADGRVNLPAATLYAATRPWRVPLLMRIGGRTRRAMAAATEAILPLI